MKTTALILLVLLGLSTLGHAHEGHDHDHDHDHSHEEVDEKDVVVLTSANFNETLDKNLKVLVEFYAPWCGHCQHLKPEYAKAATELKKLRPDVILAKVDATEHTDLADRFDIKGFPTMIFFNNGTQFEFASARTANDIIATVIKKTSPPIHFAFSMEAVRQHDERHDVVVLYAAKGRPTGPEFQIFKHIAALDDDNVYLATNSTEVIEHYKLESKKFPCIILIKDFDEGRADYEGKITMQGLEDFVKANAHPLVARGFTDKLANRIFSETKPALIVFHEKGKEGNVLPAVETLAKETKGKLIVVASTIVGDMEESLAEFIGATEDKLPVISIIDFSKESPKNYNFDREITAENLLAFWEDFSNDRLTPHKKSEEPPANNDGPVKVVVGKTWDAIVLDPSKDVLVEFYAPWCGHCQEFEPEYEALAKKLQRNENLILAKIDGTANDIEGQEIEGFPTIVFFPASNKKGIAYEGERTHDDLIKFIRENGGSVSVPSSEL